MFKVNILYDEKSNHVFTIKNYMEMFQKYSINEIIYTPATENRNCGTKELEKFDAIIIFYSIRVCVKRHLSKSYEKALKKFKGLKVLFIQDDYDYTEVTRKAIEKLGIQMVYTVVPEKYISSVYSKRRFPNVSFYNILTGYISDEMKEYKKQVPKIKNRNILIGYRGRTLGRWYGTLAYEKLNIGIKMKEECRKREIENCDIEWKEEKRIYNEEWLKWLANCKCTLGTESGANIFDDKGKIRKKVISLMSTHPNMSYEELYEKILKNYEGSIKMNQISPKIFEAISLKTVLILYEGNYSGILEPDRHYIMLKKDFSNIEYVFQKIMDNDYLEDMSERTYCDIMDKYELNYRWLVQFVDSNMKEYLENKRTNNIN